MENKNKVTEEPVDFHEAAIIDENGNEVKITEEMVRKAIHEIDEDVYPSADKDIS